MFMLTSTHKAAMAEAENEFYRLNGSLFDALTKSAEWEAKFKKAVADLEQADREMRATDGLLTDAQMEAMELRHEITHLRTRLHYAEPRAQKWDDSLKRSRDRKAEKKTAPARDKRAKNRGGGK